MRVVVGVDGSPGARAALVWALAAAARRDAVLEVVSAFVVDDYWTDPLLTDSRRIDTLRSDTEARARAFVAEVVGDPAVAAVPGAAAVDVRFVVCAGAAAEHLVQRARGADLLVVGSRGRGGFRSTVLGSVALHCSAHATSPVVVVHPALQQSSARVVAGLDDSAVARTALVRAAEEAGRLGAAVEAVVVYQPIPAWGGVSAFPSPPLVGETVEAARRRGEAIVTEVLGDAVDPPVRVVAEAGSPAEVLVRLAEGAALLVVGSRSRSRLAGMVLGSVALHSVVNAPCPVMVVRPAAATPAGDGASEAATVPAAAAGRR